MTTSIHFFDISVYQLNLFSFMLGVTWAFFNQGLFGKRIGYYVFLYFASLAAWYGMLYYFSNTPDWYSQFQELMKTPINLNPQ